MRMKKGLTADKIFPAPKWNAERQTTKIAYRKSVRKTFGATVTDLYYPCHRCVTVASYRL